MELLSYANIINGLKPTEKKKLWTKLIHKNMWAADRKKFGLMYNKYDYDERLDVVYLRLLLLLTLRKKWEWARKSFLTKLEKTNRYAHVLNYVPNTLIILRKC